MSETTVRHGYTLTRLHQLTLTACRITAGTWADPADRHAAAWDVIIDLLLTAETPPTPGQLINAGQRGILNHTAAERHHRGIAARAAWAGDASAPRYACYWADWLRGRTDDPAPTVVDRQAVADIWPALTDPDRRVLIALAAGGDHQHAAALSGYTQGGYYRALRAARTRYRGWWHEGETPSGMWGRDRRVGVREYPKAVTA